MWGRERDRGGDDELKVIRNIAFERVDGGLMNWQLGGPGKQGFNGVSVSAIGMRPVVLYCRYPS